MESGLIFNQLICEFESRHPCQSFRANAECDYIPKNVSSRSEEHTSELQSPCNLVCRLLLEKKKHHPHHQHVGDRLQRDATLNALHDLQHGANLGAALSRHHAIDPAVISAPLSAYTRVDELT